MVLCESAMSLLSFARKTHSQKRRRDTNAVCIWDSFAARKLLANSDVWYKLLSQSIPYCKSRCMRLLLYILRPREALWPWNFINTSSTRSSMAVEFYKYFVHPKQYGRGVLLLFVVLPPFVKKRKLVLAHPLNMTQLSPSCFAMVLWETAMSLLVVFDSSNLYMLKTIAMCCISIPIYVS